MKHLLNYTLNNPLQIYLHELGVIISRAVDIAPETLSKLWTTTNWEVNLLEKH